MPSVREIIRQVEEMTLKNNNSAHNSNTSLDHSHSGGSIMHISRSLSRPVNAEVPSRGANSRSLSASSAQINGGTMGRTHNQNGTYYATSSNSSDYDSHTVGRGLLEAFLEQRKEIQRLRKEMADKDRLIASLQKDIHLYEPWR
ncbi:unnamed protein product [Hymenolepis diminuta]|uniref:Uncharacterized protein n=1 Tax=Hymenolepis diminuta TaxID=6216 RepID=A0A3P6ZPX5_HYMDI|nr:unnamed protein product [Hymenolepis diminuta]